MVAHYFTYQTNTFMRKLYLLLAMLLSFGSTAWADFHQPWTSTPFPWTESVTADDVTAAGMTLPSASDATYRRGSVSVTRTGSAGDVTLTFHYTSGGHALQILGVDLLNASSEVVCSDYAVRTATGSTDATFTLSSVAEGSYTLRYWVYGSAANSNSLTSTNGTITVTGLNSNYITSLEDLSNDKVYYFKSGRSSGSTSHYLLYHTAAPNNLSSTFGSGHSMTFNPSTTNFQFALYKSGETYYMYNIEAGKFVGNANTNNAAIPLVMFPSNGITLKPSGNSTYTWVMSTNNFVGALNAANTSGCHGVVNWTGGNANLTDGGNIYQICEAGDLSTDIQTTIANRITWGPVYTTIKEEADIASDTRMGALTVASGATISAACTAFEANPNGETYAAMQSAYSAGERTTLSAGEKFTVKCIEDSRGYLVYSTVDGKGSETIANLAGTANASLPSLTDDGVYKEWVFVEKDGKKYIYNVQNQKFLLKGTPVKFDDLGTYVVFEKVGTALYTIKFEGASQYLSFSQGWGLNMCVRTEGSVDNGCKFYIDKTGESDPNFESIEGALYKSELDSKLAKGRLYGTGLGKYSYSGSEDVATTVSNAESLLTNDAATKTQITGAIAALEALYANFSINLPEIGKLYRFKGKASSHYICPTGTGTTDSDFMAMNSSSDYAGTVFMLYEGDQVGGTTGYKLLNYGTGYFTTRTYCNGAMKAAANSVKFAESPTNPGCYTIQSNASGIGTYLYDQDSKVNRNTTYQANNCDWTIEEVTWLPIPVSSTYRFGTFKSPANLAITDAYYTKDERLKFYIAKVDPNDNYVVLTQVTDNFPANQSYVIEYIGGQYTNGCSFLKIADSAPAIDEGTNELRGSFETIATPTDQGTIYTLQPAWVESEDDNHNSATDVAFRQYNGTNIQGFRAYLPVAPGVQPAGIRFYEGDVTRIEGVEEGQTHKVDVYDLSGRRVQRATKGLYIVNGKKVLVK